MRLFVLPMALLLAGCGVKLATVKDAQDRDLMLLGHDPVAYFTVGKPVKGDPRIAAEHDGVWYYFSTRENVETFRKQPGKFVPQYGAFCASGAAYGVKLGSDPTEFAIRNGRLFIFGDVLGREYWEVDPDWHVKHADQMWPEAGASGHRWQSIKRILWTVPWYKNAGQARAEWRAKNPDSKVSYDPGGSMRNLFLKYPGWRAREGFGQPALGVPGVDPCPPACPGSVSEGYKPPT
jgi:YHS domain-containing protein